MIKIKEGCMNYLRIFIFDVKDEDWEFYIVGKCV